MVIGMRDKLVELLSVVTPLTFDDRVTLANYLIRKGVTIPVRCKDCKHRIYVDMGDDIGAIGGCELLGCAMQYDAFCSYGERRTENE